MTIENDFFKDSKMASRALGELLHNYVGDGGLTFQRDMQVFMYARYSIINKNLQIHNDEGFGIDDAAYNLGSAFASLIQNLAETSSNMGQPLSQEEINRMYDIFEKDIIVGFRDKIEMLKNDPTITVGYPETMQ